MQHKNTLIVLTILAVFLSPLHHAAAAERDATLELMPACPHDRNDSEEPFGPIPDVEGYVTLGDDVCPSFHVEDPQTLRTNPLQVGDTLAIDVVIDNPSRQPVNHARVWLSYDPALLEGDTIEINDSFPAVTPGESDFDPEDGYVMIEASNDEEDANTQEKVLVATVTFRVTNTSSAGTPITFYDVQAGGHTAVDTTENGDDAYILEGPPGSLKVVFGDDETDSPNNADAATGATTTGTSDSDDENFESLFDDEETAASSSSAPAQEQTPPSSSPTNTPPAETTPPRNTTEQPQRTSFSLLQVRNVRVTTKGSSLYIGWDALNHQNLKAYNVYYGTTSGRYIQRKTISGDMTSLVIRSLPVGETYYVAIRAVSRNDEESAFSREASVEIGDPQTSTAPLQIQSVDPGPNGVNPMQGNVNGTTPVPGETGLSSAVAWFIVASAIIGTGIAVRRQTKAHSSYTS